MDISARHTTAILNKLYSVYPLMLDSQGYAELVEEVGDDLTLDAHLLYLYEKRLIETDMKYDPYTLSWSVSAHLTRINSNGIDLIASA